MSYNELIERGTEHFPIELYLVDKDHPRYEMASHWHNEVELIRIISGNLNVKLNTNEYLAKENDIIFINPDTIHGAVPVNDCVYECIVMHLDMLNAKAEECSFFIDCLLNNQIFIKEIHHNPPENFKTAVNQLFDYMRGETKGYKFCVISALYSMLGAVIDDKMYENVLSDENLIESKNISKLKKVLTFIRENYHEQITLYDMAKKSNMSQKYFCMYFKEMTRKTPVEYLILHRIECAAKKLRSTDMNVTDIALSCGFNDLSYFIKTFKKIKGITPAQFRKM